MITPPVIILTPRAERNLVVSVFVHLSSVIFSVAATCAVDLLVCSDVFSVSYRVSELVTELIYNRVTVVYEMFIFPRQEIGSLSRLCYI